MLRLVHECRTEFLLECNSIVAACPQQPINLVAGRLWLRNWLWTRAHTPRYFVPTFCPGFPSTKCTIWKAARATSAAPTFFKAMHIDQPSPGMDYVDGGLGHNNPSLLAREEAKRIWPASKSCCLISIGTGLQKSVEVHISKQDDDAEAQRSVFRYIKDFVPDLA